MMSEENKAAPDTSEISQTIAKMWLGLAEHAHAAAKEILVASSTPEVAAQWAKYAEAFYWRATGESDAIDLSTDNLP